MMLQDKLYPKWATRARKWWNTGYRRIIVFWVVTFLAFFIVLLVIATSKPDTNLWGNLFQWFFHCISKIPCIRHIDNFSISCVLDWINWDTLNAYFVATNEASRSFLASFILVMDLLIVMQVCLRCGFKLIFFYKFHISYTI